MSSVTFDTLKFAERLEQAGVPRAQAAAMAEAQREALAEALDTTLATKADIARVEGRLETMELRLTIRLGIFLAVASGSSIAVLRLSH